MVLPQHILPRREKTADANELGTLCHWWKEHGETYSDFPRPLTKKHEAHIATLERKLFMSGVDRDHWWPEGGGHHEVTFAFSPFTRELRQYEDDRGAADAWKKSFAPQEWVTGTIDWLGRRRGRWWVDDLKTGAWPVDVETSKQLRSYTIVPWLMDGQPDDWECDVSITSWPKYPLAGEPVRTWHVLNSFDVEEHLHDLKWALANPHVVRPSDYGNSSDKLPHCAGCECREPMDGVSGWITNFWYRTLPHCTPGMVKRVYG